MATQVLPLDDDLIDRKEMSRMSGLSVATIATKACRDPKWGPPPYKYGTAVRYKRSEVRDWIEMHRVENGVKIATLGPGQQPRPWE